MGKQGKWNIHEHSWTRSLHELVRTMRTSLVAQMIKNLPTVWKTQVRSWFGKISWRRDWQPTPVFLPGKIPWGHRESDKTEQLTQQNKFHQLAILVDTNYCYIVVFIYIFLIRTLSTFVYFVTCKYFYWENVHSDSLLFFELDYLFLIHWIEMFLYTLQLQIFSSILWFILSLSY